MLVTKVMVKEKIKLCVLLLCIERRDHENVEEKSANHSII